MVQVGSGRWPPRVKIGCGLKMSCYEGRDSAVLTIGTVIQIRQVREGTPGLGNKIYRDNDSSDFLGDLGEKGACYGRDEGVAGA
jgi:hypothetical protein